VRNGENLPVAAATLELDGLKSKTYTDKDGKFSFGEVSPGTYTLRVTHLSYHIKAQTIQVQAGKTLDMDILADQSQTQLEPVVITAEKRENSLQKAPMAVSALTGKQIEEKNVRAMEDLVLAVPNLFTMNIGSPTLNIIAIRGIVTFSTDQAVGVYVDGVPMFDGYSASQQFQNIERVEVLRGPQSTLYGRNGLGGVINIITKQPSNNLNGFASVGIGNYGSQRYNFALSGPLVSNKLFAGISGLYDVRKGFYTNSFSNSKYDHPETINGNFYLKYLASDKLSFTLNAKAEHNNVNGVFPYVSGAERVLQNPYVINQDGTNIEKRKLYSASLLTKYSLRGAELSSVTGFTHLDDTYKDYDVDYSPYDIMRFETPSAPQNTLTQEFKIVTDARKRLKFTGGLFGFIDNKKSVTSYIYGRDAAVFYPNDPTYGNAPFTSTIYTDKAVYGGAAFANLTYALTKKLDITAGLRYDYEKRNMTYSNGYLKEPAAETVTNGTKIFGSNTAFSPKFSMSYSLANDRLVYVTYSRGYRSGGFNPYTAILTRLNYQPEYTDNYEVGFKSEWFNHRLRANAALFFTHWTDQQQVLSLPENLTDNVGELTSKGGELELTGLILKGLELNYNLGVVNTDYRHLILLDENGQNKDYAGNKQIFTPNFTSSLSATYRYNVDSNTSLYVVPEWKYFGKQYMTYYNDLIQSPFNLLNLSVGAKFKKIELSLWGKNLGNATYISYAYATQFGAATPVLLGNPRTFGTSIKVNF
jgi:iron complex outermembrane receptor protein